MNVKKNKLLANKSSMILKRLEELSSGKSMDPFFNDEELDY